MHPFDGGGTHFSVWKDHARHLFKLYFLVPYPWGESRPSSLCLGPGICIVTTIQRIPSDPDIQETKL